MKRFPVFLFFMAISMLSLAQDKPVSHAGPVNWMTFEQAVEANKKEKKQIFIDVYTTWCGPCKMMDKFTFSDPEVAKILNTRFYPVKLNAEQREDITVLGTTFKFVASGNSGYHQLAASLLNNKLQYPTLVFMSEDVKIIQSIPGFQKAPEFHKIIKFIGEGHFKTMKWEAWQGVYKSPYTTPTPESGK
jgi:thioredoxin-related protein